MSRNLALAALLTTGCIQAIGTPDLGPCADAPDATYTYGEAGIGTCLAGPVDLRFLEQGGTTWLGVVNADPYRNFASGSLLLVDWDSVDLDSRLNLMDEVVAAALPMDPFVGGLAFLPDRDLALVTGRLSDGSPSRTAKDELWVVDVSDPSAPALWPEGESLELEDDPQLIAVDDATGLAFVANLTDHSISVVDTTTTPLSEVDVVGVSQITSPRFFDHDDSDSSATAHDAAVVDSDLLVSDEWTLSWVDGTYRVWVPTGDGLARWSTGGMAYVASGLGLEVDPEESDGAFAQAVDPFLGFVEGTPVMYFSDEGVIRLVGSLDATIGSWDHSAASVPIFEGIGGWDAHASSPVVLDVGGTTTLFYDGRTDPGAPAGIGELPMADDGTFYSRDEATISAPAGYESVEHPWVWDDPFTSTWRMWLSLHDGERWSIGLAESDDGSTWSEPEAVLSLEAEDVAAPVVTWASGRYRMWLAWSEGGSWWLSEAWSYDGMEWHDLRPVLETDAPLDQPPRVALQADPSMGWRVEGRDSGVLPSLATAGSVYQSLEFGFAFVVSSGFEADAGLLDDDGAAGMAPGSHGVVDGVATLYVTGTDAEGREHIGALQWLDERWSPVALDLIPAGSGGNAEGAGDPVVVGEDGAWTMYYAGRGADGRTRLYRAISADGLTWAPEGGALLESGSDWDAIEQRPHSLEPLEGGGVRLWYAGFNGTRYRIGAATSTDGLSFTPEEGTDQPWLLGTGSPGEFDDSGVRDPMVVSDGDTLHLWYAGSPDGESWNIGYASRPVDGGEWERLLDGDGDARPALAGVSRTFSSDGVRAPVAVADGDRWIMYHAGTDGVMERLGRARGGPRALFHTQRYPTLGDELVFSTRPGTAGVSVIELGQRVEGRAISGIGVAGMRLDPERGFLYVVSKKTNFVWIIDIRDDSQGSFVDSNYLDLEGVVTVVFSGTAFGLRDVVRRPGTDLLYASGQFPDSLVVFDISEVEDDDRKQIYRAQAVADLPLAPMTDASNTLVDDAGEETLARIAGAGLTFAPDERTLMVAHFRANGIVAFDLEQGHYGEEVAWVPHVGENPHLIRVTPDGRHAVVANYLGDVEDDLVQSNLAVIDIDPESDTWMEVVTWLVNQ